ncbi:hypothetical protein BKD30_03475 [Tersicoccus phoenicis]|uniref:Cardiolipin synthase N-terminal domain-containing protein n=1 Tax=Tersicoccus phoenicis TaxID=554083 RepID=A0A1R1LJK7_9MICC|nr:PLDc N-terminal domain-containing protein [Tersicoccus phoenicis]OMH27712.1 hypothetical protein BKD30_03475 [Tersicoccus phoenicis]
MPVLISSVTADSFGAAEVGANPLLSTAWEVLAGGIGLALLFYLVVGLVSVLADHGISGPVRAAWAVVVLAFPLIGPTAWFLWRSQQRIPRHRGAVRDRRIAGEAFSSRANVLERCVVKVDPDVPLEMVAPLGCGLQTGAGAVAVTW